MRVGVIGCGSIGSRHEKNLKALGHDVALCDLRSDLFPHFLRVDDMVGIYQPDAVLICTPASTHVAVARQLLDAGFRSALFVEKPLALSTAECDVFRSWPSPVTMVGYNLRFHPKMRQIRAAVPHPISGGFYCDCDARDWPGANYGPMFLECSHELDAALFCGAPPVVSPSSSIREHAADVWLGEDDRWLFSYDSRSTSYVRHWMLSDAGVRDDDDGVVRFHSPDQLGDQMYVDELAHFLSCVETNTPTMTPFADGIRVVDICEEAMRMAKETV